MNRLAISFSGGRTSAYMLLYCLKHYADREIVITFANTGCEHPATLDFVRDVDRLVGGRVVWLEADVSPEHGVGISHRVVSYETASRNGEPFKAYIAKYGIPNSTAPNCTTRLKSDVMEDYIASVIGWRYGARLSHQTAIGIRYDELDRVSENASKYGFVYPLVEARVTKGMVLDFWKKQPFDLQLPGEHYGNCVWCWKKSLRKLMTLAKESPHVFDFPREMEAKYGHIKANGPAGNGKGRRMFFRKHMSVDDIFAASEKPFEPYRDNHRADLFDVTWDQDLDIGGGCGDTCEIGADRE